MIKKLIAALLAVTMLLACTACTNEAKETATANAEGFLNALCDGDFETAKAYCTEDAYKATGIGELSNLDARFCKTLGYKKSDLSKEAIASIDELTDYLQKEFVITYKITDVEESKTGVIIKARIEYGFDICEFDKIKISDKECDKIADGYLDKHQDELLEVYRESGEDAMMKEIISDLMPKFIKKYKSKVEKLGTHEDIVQITLDKKKGKYIITNISSDGIADTDHEMPPAEEAEEAEDVEAADAADVADAEHSEDK